MINKLSVSSKNSMLTRIITGFVLIALLVPCLVLGGWFFFIFFAVLAVVGIHEILTAPGSTKFPWYVKVGVYVFLLSFIFWIFVKNWASKGEVPGDFYLKDIFVSISGLIMYALFLLMVAVFSTKVTLSDVTYLFTVGLIFALGFQCMYFLRYFPNSPGICLDEGNILSSTMVNPPWLNREIPITEYMSTYYNTFNLSQRYNSSLIFFFMLIGTWGADVGAYFFGTFFGKHRMNPRISPHKTWEGFIGGAFFSTFLSLGFAAICEYCFKSPLVPGLIQFADSPLLKSIHVFSGTAWPFLVFLAILMPIIGNVGGFAFSLIKRQFGIKDYGKIFPGHGGVIDRFDSILTNSIMCSLVLLFTSHAWNFLL